MSKSNVSVAEAYYTAMAKKDMNEMEKYLHPEARLISPLDELEGKEAIRSAAKRFTELFTALTIRAKCGSDDQAMLAIDLNFPAPIGNVRTAVLVSFKEELMAKIELFFDPRYLEPNKDEIYRGE